MTVVRLNMYLVVFCVIRINQVRNKSSYTNHDTSPWEAYHGRPLDATLDLQFERVNALYSTSFLSGSGRFLKLPTDIIVTRNHYRVLPTPPLDDLNDVLPPPLPPLAADDEPGDPLLVPSAHRGDGDALDDVPMQQSEPTEEPSDAPEVVPLQPQRVLRPRKPGPTAPLSLIPKTRAKRSKQSDVPPSGEFERLKARLVAGGDGQDRSLNAEIKSKVHMRLEPTLVAVLVDIDPDYSK
mmetsp:Transcript_22785/g.22993  ORF Transcript_22785/g.22993 Transcript_22785/m.22993 type:complete len:238 (-) Transcript_22785:6-719(-)